MPKDNKITGNTGKPAAKPATRVTPTTNPTAPAANPVPVIESKPEASALATAAKSIKLPNWLTTSQMPQVSDRQVGGFVGFASAQSKRWNEQQNAGLSDGQPYLFHQQRYIPLKSLDFFLLAGESFQTLMVGKGGEFQWASRDLEEEGPIVGSNRPEPHYVCLLIVLVDGQPIAIKGDFRGTKSGGIEGAIRAVESAATPEWLSLSDAHRLTAAFPQPFGRVFHRITTKYVVSKTSGNPYYRANCISTPATFAQMQELVNILANEEFSETLAECRRNYDARISFLDDVISGKARA